MKFALLGLGTVGQGILEIYFNRKEILRRQHGLHLELAGIFDRSWQKKQNLFRELKGCEFAYTNFYEMLEQVDADVVIEVTGNVDQAFEWIKAALSKRKHVITANKALLAKHGNELFALAKKVNRHLLFESAVGGALPVIKTSQNLFAMDPCIAVYGILNTTSNFILSAMMSGLSFAAALKNAQKQGYAEADPSFDIEGHDAAQKIILLSSILFNRTIDATGMAIEGITHIELEDLKMIRQMGYYLRPIASAQKEGDTFTANVRNYLVKEDHLFASISQSRNAVCFLSRYAKKTILMGEGAGAQPTASAVMSDLFYLSQIKEVAVENRFTEEYPISPEEQEKKELHFYVRISMSETDQVAEIEDILPKNLKVPISRLIKNKNSETAQLNIIILTGLCTEKHLRERIEQIAQSYPLTKAIYPLIPTHL